MSISTEEDLVPASGCGLHSVIEFQRTLEAETEARQDLRQVY
jgi:hypothetical protein